MTKLENQLATEMFGISVIGTVLTDDQVRQVTAASEVCKGYIERAFDAGVERGQHESDCCEMAEHPDSNINAPKNKENWLKSEGITE